MTTVDISIKAMFTQEMLDAISKSPNPAARYIAAYSQERYYLWDELAACAWLDPSIITKNARRLHGHRPEPWAQLRRHAHVDAGTEARRSISSSCTPRWTSTCPKFTKMFVELMSAPTPKP